MQGSLALLALRFTFLFLFIKKIKSSEHLSVAQASKSVRSTLACKARQGAAIAAARSSRGFIMIYKNK
jgi:hypothetical protein